MELETLYCMYRAHRFQAHWGSCISMVYSPLARAFFTAECEDASGNVAGGFVLFPFETGALWTLGMVVPDEVEWLRIGQRCIGHLTSGPWAPRAYGYLK